MRRSVSPLPALAIGALVLSACGDSSADSDATGDGTVTVTNCDVETEYAAPVQQIVATSNTANIGTLLRVGAGSDDFAAIAMNPNNDEVMRDLYDVDLGDVSRLDSPIPLEAIVGENPDLLIGSYSGLFSGSSGVTVEDVQAQDIPTYIISDSCRQDPEDPGSALGTMDPWDAVRTDLANYGTLLDAEETAEEAIADLDERLAALDDAPAPDTAPDVLLFDSGTDDLYTSGRNGPPQGIIEAAGGTNVFEDEDTTWFRASWEAVAAAEPDVIVVLDYRGDDENEVADKLTTVRSQPALRDLEAVTEDRIVVLPLTLFTSGHPNIEAAESLRASFDELGLTPDSDIDGQYVGYGR